jgi:hypothetical protein
MLKVRCSASMRIPSVTRRFIDVPASREQRGRLKSRTQQSFRLSGRELVVYDAYGNAYTFDNRSDFLNAVLDAFLPPLPATPKRAAARLTEILSCRHQVRSTDPIRGPGSPHVISCLFVC